MVNILYILYLLDEFVICAFQESCFAKVDKLLKIKHKQDQDKAAVGLHSFK